MVGRGVPPAALLRFEQARRRSAGGHAPGLGGDGGGHEWTARPGKEGNHMKWVDRYISAIGDRLPAKQRKDIETELRSLILDALEGRTGKATDFSEEDELAVLREFGRPEVVAQRYAPSPRYLIGPRLYPIYLIVLRILVIVSFFGASIGLIVQHVS